LIEADKGRLLRYSPLNGVTAKSYFEKKPDLSTVIFLDEDVKYYRSDAAIRALMTTQRKFFFLSVLLWIPRMIRDGVYNWVAKKRHLFFQNEICLLPNHEQRALFLP
jgi:predicted DCC family thiol-disulfide oxidoreductase YuxK